MTKSTFCGARTLFFIILCAIFTLDGNAKASENCSELKEGPPRGIQCLHCQLTEDYTKLLTQMLLDSCYKNVAVAYVVDGSFGNKLSVIQEQVETLRESGRETYVQLYLINGPAQRRFYSGTFKGLWNNISTIKFREMILTDKQFKKKYLEFVSSLSSLIHSLGELGSRVAVAPMLEDNLTNKSFVKLLALTQSMLPEGVEYVRSACSDCFPGNQWQIPEGVTKEDHRFSKKFDQTDGVISNDGWGYLYFNKKEKAVLDRPVTHPDRTEEVVSLSDLKPMMTRAGDQNNVFLLWISKYQQTLPGNRSKKVKDRKFPKPTVKELSALSEFFAS